MSDKYRIKRIQYECLTDSDFYPPSDNRVLKSYIEDVDEENNFADYCKYIFDIYEEEGYYD